MFDSEIGQLTVQERGILATNGLTTYLDEFARTERRPISAYEPPVLLTRKRKYYSHGQEFIVEWQDLGQPLPRWFDPLMQGFTDILALPVNWDSYGAGTVQPGPVNVAMNVANGIMRPSTPSPRVVPLSSGGVQLEWHREGIDVELIFDPEEEPSFYYRNSQTGEEADGLLSESWNLLAEVIGGLE